MKLKIQFLLSETLLGFSYLKRDRVEVKVK
jgi:hypothetical protein